MGQCNYIINFLFLQLNFDLRCNAYYLVHCLVCRTLGNSRSGSGYESGNVYRLDGQSSKKESPEN